MQHALQLYVSLGLYLRCGGLRSGALPGDSGSRFFVSDVMLVVLCCFLFCFPFSVVMFWRPCFIENVGGDVAVFGCWSFGVLGKSIAFRGSN